MEIEINRVGLSGDAFIVLRANGKMARTPISNTETDLTWLLADLFEAVGINVAKVVDRTYKDQYENDEYGNPFVDCLSPL